MNEESGGVFCLEKAASCMQNAGCITRSPSNAERYYDPGEDYFLHCDLTSCLEILTGEQNRDSVLSRTTAIISVRAC